MADPLTLLREYNICKKEIIENKNLIIFGDCAFQKDVNTNYRTYMAMKDGTNYCYTLECLLFFLKNVHLFHRDYCKEATAANVPEVGRADRKTLLAYLNGETESSPSIVQETPPSIVKETPSSIVKETPSSIVKETSPSIVKETPPSIVKETPSSIVKETPSSIVKETSPSIVKETLPCIVETKEQNITADPLSILREYNMYNKEIIEDKNNKLIIFGDCAFPKDVKTNYFTHRAVKYGTKECYTLECLLFFLNNHRTFHPNYCKEAAAANIPAVRRPDRKILLAYLNGETESSPCIRKGRFKW